MTSVILSYIRSEPINSIEKQLKKLTIAKGFWEYKTDDRNEQNFTPMKSRCVRDEGQNTPAGESTDDSGTSYRENCDNNYTYVNYFPTTIEGEGIQKLFVDYDEEVTRTYKSSMRALRTIQYTEVDDDSSVSTLGSVVSDARRDMTRSKVSSFSHMVVGSF